MKFMTRIIHLIEFNNFILKFFFCLIYDKKDALMKTIQ
jgi:hypothetical protein